MYSLADFYFVLLGTLMGNDFRIKIIEKRLLFSSTAESRSQIKIRDLDITVP